MPILYRLSSFVVSAILGAGACAQLHENGPEKAASALVEKTQRRVDNQDGDVGEKPRQRRRVLDKRNPLATEYQSIGDIGTVTLSDVDSEGIDNRARFPFAAPFAGSGRAAAGEISYNYNELSDRGLLQGKASYGQVLDAAGRWAVSEDSLNKPEVQEVVNVKFAGTMDESLF